MSSNPLVDFAVLYSQFEAPISRLNCGDRCAPYNERGVPFCCDSRHTIPTAYAEEWEYLRDNTDLWQEWEGQNAKETSDLKAQAPTGHRLIVCQGHELCQRGFRSLTCRSFPFFPYLNNDGDFLGLSYYWDYEGRCWVISNLQVVSPEYQTQFIAAYLFLFERMPEERENFRYYSIIMRRIFGRKKRAIPLLHRNGFTYKISPRNGRMRRVPADSLPKYGPYKIADKLRFPDEV